MKKSYLLIVVPILLVMATLSAIARVGCTMPIGPIAAKHGFLMVSGLLATLISLEKTLLLKQRWWLCIPTLSATSAILVLIGVDNLAYTFQLLSALLFTSLYIKQWLQHRDVFLLVLTLSGIAWLFSGLVIILGNGFPAASIWYILFLLYTIAGNRLRHNNFTNNPSWAKPILLVLFALLFAAQAIPFHLGANHISGILIVAIGYCLLQFDVAKLNPSEEGLLNYSSTTMFVGYIWLMICGVLMALPLNTVFHYDAVLHCFFIGFTISMLFASMPTVFPALLGLNQKTFHPILYIPVWLTTILQLTRLYADYSSDWQLRKLIGMAQVVVILGFFLLFALLLLRKKRRFAQ